MRFDYIDPFVDSARDILKNFIESDIKKSSVTLKDSISAKGISVTIFFAGSINGCVVLDIEPELGKKIAGCLNGMEFDRIDRLAIDTICEISNIIIGKAVTTLNNKGFRFKPSPPCFFIGEKTYSGLESLCIDLSTEWGNIRIQAAIMDKEKVVRVERGAYV